jgi:hypothetical protein
VAQAALDTIDTITPAPNAAPGGAFYLDTNGVAPPPPPKMVRVKLLRNYRPMEALDPTDPKKQRRLDPVFEIVGYWKPAVVVRNILGKEETIAPETFVEGEPAPSPKAGVGYTDKLWAGTIVRFTSDEAKYIKANGIGEIEIDD